MIYLNNKKIESINNIDILLFNLEYNSVFYNPSWRDNTRLFISDIQNNPMKHFEKDKFYHIISWNHDIDILFKP